MFFWKLLFQKKIGQKKDFLVFVSHKKFIIEYFNEKNVKWKEGRSLKWA
jgi:hypothetical protein